MFYITPISKMSGETNPPAMRPDIILIVADDINYNILRQSRCPNIKTMMGSGANFTKAYNYGGSGGAVCKSSRQMTFFGQPWDKLSGNSPFPAKLRQHGYHTFATGKWHNSGDAFSDCFESYQDVFFGGMISRRSHLANPTDGDKLGKRLPGGVFATALTQYITNYRNSQPYFAYIGFTEPHDPLHLINQGNGNTARLPANFQHRHPFDFGQTHHRDEKLMPRPLRRSRVQKNILKYMSMMTYLDSNIGTIIQSLTRPTVVIFTTDNGICKGNHGLLGKQNLYQESIHIPLCLWSNYGAFSGNCAKLVYLYDIYPTVLQLAHIPANPSNTPDATSLLRLLAGNSGRKYARFRFKSQIYAIIANGWKLIWYRSIKKFRLYHLAQDPLEMKPVKPEKVPDIFERLQQDLLARK